jgi:hypothetical protein
LKILFNGDSHTVGSNTTISDRFSNLVASAFDADNVNLAKVGGSNTRILRTTQEYINNNSVDLIVIGWTTWEREEWEYHSKYYDVNSSGHDVLPVELTDKYKNWVVKQTPETLISKSQKWHETIYNFHLELEQKNIKHLFFNCMYNFFQPLNEYNWSNQYIGPYDNNSSYYWNLKNQGIDADSWYHYGADGHAVWAKLLINYIKEHKLS